ncbi:MAG: LysR family transcriptional regulator [Deltaproteobacteria bacterium]|nr:LysR family transcriptional regulator [Deltaproteobacteria bacterium]
MINFTQLRDFYQVAKNLNFTVAASKLFISQPAVTAQVKLFEDYCKLKLFKKRGRNIYLTDEGKTLYDCAIKIFEYEREIENLIEDMRKLKRGTLRLGTTKTYARYFMPFLISRFHKSYPQIKIHLDEGSSLDMCNSLFNFKNELAIIAKALDNPDICFMPFSQEELIIILSPSHRLVNKETVSIREIAREPIIMKENGSGTRKLVCELFAKNGLTPNILVETSNTEFIKQLVARKYGISFLVKAAVEKELKEENLASVSIEGEKIFLDVSIAHLKGCHFSPPAQTFMNILKKLALKYRPNNGIRSLNDMINVYNK